MKKKELKTLAEKIAKQEMIIKNSDNPKEKQIAEKEIEKLSKCVKKLEDIILVDELVIEILQKKS